MDAEGDVTVDDLLAATRGTPFAVRHERCKEAVQAFLPLLVERWGGPRKVVWDVSGDSEAINRQIARLATLVAAMRSDGRGSEEGEEEVLYGAEKPYRAYAVLYNLARGHALVYGRSQLTEEDLPLIGRVTASTMPMAAGRAFQALVRAKGEPLCVSEVQKAIGAKHPETARHAILELAGRGIATFEEHGRGVTATVQFCPDRKWCVSEEARNVLWSQLVSDPEVCASPATQDLVQLRRERKGEEGEESTHTPELVTSGEEGMKKAA